MSAVKMKGRSVDDAVNAALAVLGVTKEGVDIKILTEGKPGLMGVIGGEEAEVEVSLKGSSSDSVQLILQEILDKMGLLAIAEVASVEGEYVRLAVKGEDMGRIIGKEGAMLKALETVVNAIVRKGNAESAVRIRIDAGGYIEKREKVLQKLAAEVADEVEKTGQEKVLPFMEAADRRAIHMYLSEFPKIQTFSKGEGKDRRLVIAPK